jgi:O-antigen ligase
VTQRILSLVIASYLLLCIIFGGSAQSAWTNLGLQVGGIALLAAAAMFRPRTEHGGLAVAVNVLLICGLLWVLLQLIPLPPAVWTSLPGRSEIAGSLSLLGYPLRAAPISEMPFQSVLTLFAAIPAIAAFCATERLAPSGRAIAAAIVGGMIAAIFIGAIQVAGGAETWAYFYAIHSGGAIGFFANGNHMGTLLLVGIPMAAALVVSIKPKGEASTIARYAIGVALFVVVAVGIALNGSRAALGLSIPILLASAAVFPSAVRWRGAALGGSAIALAVGVAVVMTSPMSSAELSPSTASWSDRGEVWEKTAKAIGENFPVGTGLGTFETIYHRYEDPTQVTASFVNHAHNEYLELALELGLAGMLLMGLFLAWWGVAAARIWTSVHATAFGRASTIATAAILAHSVVDFPLRTGAISAIFAACLALMANDLRTSVSDNRGERRATRHVKLG